MCIEAGGWNDLQQRHHCCAAAELHTVAGALQASLQLLEGCKEAHLGESGFFSKWKRGLLAHACLFIWISQHLCLWGICGRVSEVLTLTHGFPGICKL